MSTVLVISTLTHLCLVSHKRDICKQCRPRSDAAEWNLCSESSLFAFNTGISKKHGSNKTVRRSTASIGKGLFQHVEVRSPFCINRLRGKTISFFFFFFFFHWSSIISNLLETKHQVWASCHSHEL